ncbi:prepilin peptidase [Brevibacillus laterosporus]|uniref:Prepilin peptidase n=1 Tax=Brevibacillus laterosporus TaxID=1465 RepID=A0A518V4U4_BRELA|nr:A24 family peptidase [Brevibacillus laterosporus]QDX92007.1 prepilin peptidase [Brevibacillus laterosporus]
MSLVLIPVLATAAYYDGRYRRVPNWLVGVTLCIAGLLRGAIGEIGQMIVGVGTGFLLTLLPVLVKGMGMGDQKLLMLVGSYTSPSTTYWIFCCSLVVSICFLLVYPSRISLTYHHLKSSAGVWLAHGDLWLPEVGKSALPLPYAISLLLAYIIYLVKTYV